MEGTEKGGTAGQGGVRQHNRWVCMDAASNTLAYYNYV